jgi:rRNA-processing protein FCF1
LGEVTVVFDGRSTTDETDRASDIGVRVAFAPGGPNAADDAIVEMVGSLDDPEDTVVVTSDRGLVDRVRRLGVKVESARTFLSRLEPSA